MMPPCFTHLPDNSKARTKILLVDVLPDNLLALQAILQDSDYQLLQAATGHQALSLLEENEVGLIILDVRMTMLDGLDTATLIRARHANPQLPILFLSRARLEANHLDRALSLGTVDYITKPIEPVGLSISSDIIKKHQGEILVDSRPGLGSTFTVLLPIKGRDPVTDGQLFS